MKLLIFLSGIFLLNVSAENCNKKRSHYPTVYKGRLEIKALCMNYTIKLLEGKIDTSKIVTNWQDESSTKKYTNVFALGSPCSFPASIKEGDEFYFIIDSSGTKDCAVCMAYAPKPHRSLPIKVVQQ